MLLALSCLPSAEIHAYAYALVHELGYEISIGWLTQYSRYKSKV